MGKGVEGALRFAVGVLMARVLGPEGFGLLNLALTLERTAQETAQSSLRGSVLKYVSHHMALGEEAQAKGTVYGALIMNGAVGLLACTILFLGAEIIALRCYNLPELTVLVRILALSVPIQVINVILLAALRSLQAITTMVILESLVLPGALLGAYVIAARDGSPVSFAWAVTGSSMVGLVCCWWAIRQRLLVPARACRAVIPWRALVSFAVPMGLLALSPFGGAGLDMLILGSLLSPEDLGIYSAVWRGAGILALPLTITGTILAPSLSALHAVGDADQLRKAYVAATAIGTYASMWLLTIVLFGRGFVMGLFGEGFAGGDTALAVVCLGQFVNAATGSVTHVITMTGRPWLAVIDNLLAAAALVAASFLFVPTWGLLGAAIIVSSALACLNLARVVRVWKLYSVLPYDGSTARMWPPFLIAAAIAAAVSWAVPGDGGALASVIILAAVLTWIGRRQVLALWREVQEERRSCQDADQSSQ